MIHEDDTLPCSQENALEERSHLETHRYLRNMLHDVCNSSKWSHLMPFVQKSIINRVHGSTVVLPMDLAGHALESAAPERASERWPR